MAALSGRRQLEPVHEWRLDVVSGRRLHVGLRLSVGMDAVLLRQLGLRSRLRMVLATGLLEHVGSGCAGGEPASADASSKTAGPRHGNGPGGWWPDDKSSETAVAHDDQCALGWCGCAAWIGA